MFYYSDMCYNVQYVQYIQFTINKNTWPFGPISHLTSPKGWVFLFTVNWIYCTYCTLLKVCRCISERLPNKCIVVDNYWPQAALQ